VWYNSVTNETQLWRMDGHRTSARVTVLDERGDPVFVGSSFEIVGVGETV
jgi:hypothetical protein